MRDTSPILKMSDEELEQATLQAARSEKESLFFLLDHLAEIERRRLYGERGFSSLWEYVTQHLGYSEAQAYERISAMRLIRKVPEARTALHEGKLTLTSTAKIANFAKKEELSSNDTKKILFSCVEKSSREVDRTLLNLAKNPTVHLIRERVKPLNQEFTRLTLDVDHEFMNTLNRARELYPHLNIDLKTLIKAALDEYIKKREQPLKTDKERKQQMDGTSQRCPPVSPPSQEKNNTSISPRTRHIPYAVKLLVRARSGDQCEFRDRSSGRRCHSKRSLQFDHIIPFAKNGPSTFENLRQLCPTHNQLHAIHCYGHKKMNSFIEHDKGVTGGSNQSLN